MHNKAKTTPPTPPPPHPASGSADEVAIIKGALDLSHKTAKAAMTPIDMVFMLPADAPLDEDTLTGVLASGHRWACWACCFLFAFFWFSMLSFWGEGGAG